jgi:hypothetical protein
MLLATLFPKRFIILDPPSWLALFTVRISKCPDHSSGILSWRNNNIEWMLVLDNSFKNLEIKYMIDNRNTVILARYPTPLHSLQEGYHSFGYIFKWFVHRHVLIYYASQISEEPSTPQDLGQSSSFSLLNPL